MFFLALLITGFALSVFGFLFYLVSMVKFEFERFAVGMGVVVFGGLISGIGLILGGYNILMELIAR